MAATQTLAQASSCRKSSSGISARPQVVTSKLRPRRGVVVLSGYGSSVRVERGHLIIEDGIGNERHKGRFSRIGHGIERLIVIGADGVVSLSALRWLADQKASFVMLERDGRVLATTGPVRPSDVRLRRAQALAHQTDLAFRMSREIIDRKLAGQERVARESLKDEASSTLIREFRSELAEVQSIDAIRNVEARAAKTYWKAWRTIQIRFPNRDIPHMPEHWLRFDGRASLLSGSSPRLAVNPINALLNYLYALLEAECRLAIAALGLDPGMGVLHMDTIKRDSLACDLMEPVRPDVDAYVLRWIARQPLKSSWFFEERNGNCRLMADVTTQLAESVSTWARSIAPLAEWAMKEIASSTNTGKLKTATRLTQSHKRALSGGVFKPKPESAPRLKNVCNTCGDDIGDYNEQCRSCVSEVATDRLINVARQGRDISHSANAEEKRSKTQYTNRIKGLAWDPSSQPPWLTSEVFTAKLQPLLAALSTTLICRRLEVSPGYANEIRRGRTPHPRHWQALANLAGISEGY